MMRHFALQFGVVRLVAAALTAPLAFGSPSFAAEPAESSDGLGGPRACQQLLSTKFFAFGGVGFAGTTSEGERAFHALAASTNALVLFTTVLAQGNTEAQLYALCGIRRLAPERFEVLARPVVDANRKVTAMAGCMMMEDRASNVVARIAGGQYDVHIGLKGKWAAP